MTCGKGWSREKMEALYAEGEISEKEKNILGKSLQLTQADPALFSS